VTMQKTAVATRGGKRETIGKKDFARPWRNSASDFEQEIFSTEKIGYLGKKQKEGASQEVVAVCEDSDSGAKSGRKEEESRKKRRNTSES